jgi:ABC-type branched-subunit amino acid transport system substrate-binding protein
LPAVRRIYASLPLSGPQGRLGREVLRGGELALERLDEPLAELIVLDAFERGAEANARRAAEDEHALAYLGDLGSVDVLESAPVLGEAGLLAVAPVATFADLGGPTLVRLMPHDGVGARAIARWLVETRVGELLVVHDHDADYGVSVGRMCVEAAREHGLAVRWRPVWNHDEEPAPDLAGAEAVLYVGVAGSGAVGMWHDLHALHPELWLLGTEGVAEEWLARELEPAAAKRTRFFLGQRAPFAFYGFEATCLILDAIAEAGGDRATVVSIARGTRDRASVLGKYSIDEHGHTTMTAYGRLAVRGGELVWDRAPRG